MASYWGIIIDGGDTLSFDLQETEVRHSGANSVGSLVFPLKPYFDSSETSDFQILTIVNGPRLQFNGTNNQIRFYPDSDDATNFCQVADTVVDSVAFTGYIMFFLSWDYANGNASLRVGATANELSSITGWSCDVTALNVNGPGVFGEFFHESVFRYATDASGTPSFDRWEADGSYIFDDIADGDGTTKTATQSFTGRNADYPVWTVNSGTWRLNSSFYLDKTATDTVGDTIYTPSTNFNDVIWEFDFKLGTTASTSRIEFNLLNESDFTATVDGYQLFIQGNDIFILRRVDNNTFGTNLITGSVTHDTDVHNAKIIRKTGGLFEIILDGVSQGFAYDDTYTSMTHLVIRNYDLTSYVDNIHSRHLHSKEFNSIETLNYDSNVLTTPSTMSSKTCDIVRLRYIDNSNTEKSIDVGRVVVGAYTSPARHYSIEYADVMEDASNIITTESGAEYFISRPKKRRFTLTFKRAGDAQDDQMETVFESIGNTKPIVISIDPDNHPEEVIYARLVRPFERRRGISKRSTYVLEFVEIL